jgi:hypothetical protein
MLVGLSDVGGRVPRGPYKTHWATLIFCLVAFSFFEEGAIANAIVYEEAHEAEYVYTGDKY